MRFIVIVRAMESWFLITMALAAAARKEKPFYFGIFFW
jgi:hypothetical protein